ncbi:hypothetical protein O7621_21805 [Solwaraspora sp. WMMD937]|uniref:hypothetical protein n=1 Tax=Solwaraspora sp. WMMD937 TaxID=3016090 RepID=UPI00249BED9B|nr:hypothetical protein [Solwaraspora sp. WMMD937]WFE20511.1 hypothetical protein O7621_21805 [Solwaraspora sp. WMMD937]
MSPGTNGAATPTSTTSTVSPTTLDGPTPKDLLPASGDHPVEIVQYQTVVLTDIPGAKQYPELAGAIDLGEENLPLYDRPAQGMIVTTEQSWSVKGVTLGRLLHSLALAPGESTKVAVIDWERRTVGTGAEKTTESDVLTSATDQNRSISELASSIAMEEQHGSSSMSQSSSSTSAGINAGIAFFGAGIGASLSHSTNKGVATSVARSTGQREVAAEAAQRIDARTQQLATAARSRNMTVVRETSQSEKEQVLTRVVTNYNHMHAMSVQYYEVVQIYQVTTKPTKLERCLFIPLKELHFTQSILKRYSDALAAAAPEEWAKKIRGANPFSAAVRKLDGCPAAKAPTTPATQGVELIDIAESSMGVYGVRKSDSAPVRYNPGTKKWDAMPTNGLASGRLKAIAPGRSVVWAIQVENDYSVVFDGTTWKVHQPTSSAHHIACGPDDSAYMLGTDDTTYRLSGPGTLTDQFRVSGMKDIVVLGANKLWGRFPDGRTEELTDEPGSQGWQKRTPATSRLARMVAAPDGAIWGVTEDNTLLVVKPGTSTWTTPQTANGAPVDRLPAGLLHAHRGIRYTVDDQPKAEAGSATRIDVWWDSAGIQAVSLSTPGQTFRCGDTRGSGSADKTHTFAAGDKLLSVSYWTDSAGGSGCLTGMRLTMQSGVVDFGSAVGSTTPADYTEDTGGAILCGLHGSTLVTQPSEAAGATRTYLTALGFHVRGGMVSQDVLDHLNDNRRHYSQAVWANADELTLSRILANYTYTPPGGKADTVPLGVRLDPKPVAVTGNYLGFRWNFATEEERLDWVSARRAANRPHPSSLGPEVTSVVGIATNGVFAEAVLGRSNSAEKIDLTRFWNWKDSPIPILPTDIAPVATGGRARDVDVKVAALAPSEAKLQVVPALPAPTGMDATLRTISSANLFRDMSGMSEISQLLSKGLELAGGNDQAAAQRASDAMKTATEHMQKMAQIAVEAISKAVPAGQVADSVSALGGLLNQGPKSTSDADD